MKQSVYSKDIFLILAASFCFMASPMLVTPLITGFSGSIGASAALMGVIGGLTNLCALLCRPLAGNLADRTSKYRLSFFGAGLRRLYCLVSPGAGGARAHCQRRGLRLLFGVHVHLALQFAAQG